MAVEPEKRQLFEAGNEAPENGAAGALEQFHVRRVGEAGDCPRVQLLAQLGGDDPLDLPAQGPGGVAEKRARLDEKPQPVCVRVLVTGPAETAARTMLDLDYADAITAAIGTRGRSDAERLTSEVELRGATPPDVVRLTPEGRRREARRCDRSPSRGPEPGIRTEVTWPTHGDIVAARRARRLSGGVAAAPGDFRFTVASCDVRRG